MEGAAVCVITATVVNGMSSIYTCFDINNDTIHTTVCATGRRIQEKMWASVWSGIRMRQSMVPSIVKLERLQRVLTAELPTN